MSGTTPPPPPPPPPSEPPSEPLETQPLSAGLLANSGPGETLPLTSDLPPDVPPPPANALRGLPEWVAVAAAIVGVLLVMGALIAAFYVMVDSSDDGASGDDGSGTPDATTAAEKDEALPTEDPAVTVDAFLRAKQDGDCAAAEAVATEDFWADFECWPEGEAQAFGYTILAGKTDEEAGTAEVPVTILGQGSGIERFTLTAVDGEWRVDAIETPSLPGLPDNPVQPTGSDV